MNETAAITAPHVASDGARVVTPRLWLRVEAAAIFVGALVAYSTTGHAWWLVPLTLLLPDLSMAGYLHSKRFGAHLYNLGHSTLVPAGLLAAGWWQDRSLVVALALVWLAHIGLDRLLGYGLKYEDRFQHTHLGMIGRSR